MSRVALVLGGSSGLGLATAEALARDGVRVGLVGRSVQRLDSARSRLPEAATFSADLDDPSTARRLCDEVSAALGPVDILVLNGGGPPPFAASDFRAAAWTSAFNAQFLNQVAIACDLLPAMRARRWGRIIVVSSTSLREPIPELVASNAFRPALGGWAKTLAAEVAPEGVTVNLLLAGRIATGRTRALDRMDATAQGVTEEEIAAASQAEVPMRRYGRPEEFAAVAAFLASDAASYVTGTAIPVDGGLLYGLG